MRNCDFFKVIIFSTICGLNAFALANDWLLYNDVQGTVQGLVFGTVHSSIVRALLAFSIIESVLLPVEVIFLGYGLYKAKSHIVDVAVPSFVAMCVDLAQLVINMVIVACREEAVSTFQYTKAAVIFCGAFIRFIIAIMRHRKYNSEGYTKTYTKVIGVVMLIGSIILVIGSICVVVFSVAMRDEQGNISFPNSAEKEDRYFTGTGIYANLQEFHSDVRGWIRLIDINDLRKGNGSEKEITIKYAVGFKYLTFGSNTTNGQNECYIKNDDHFNKLDNCPDWKSIIYNYKDFIDLRFKFRYQEPNYNLRFGNILYNVKISTNRESCKSALQLANLRYFKLKPNSKHNNHLLGTNSDKAMFYDEGNHLIDISEAWKTGISRCSPSGNVSPNHNPEIVISCSIQ